LRPDRDPHRILSEAALSRSVAQNKIPRSRRASPGVFNQRLFTACPDAIAELYKARWQIELFFKWIKQPLRIKAFFGTSANALKTQIWIAVCVYLLIAITKKRLKIEQSLYTILQILSMSVFEKMPLLQAFQDGDCTINRDDFCNQLQLFD